MTSIKLIVSGASARAEVDGLLTSGMVGIPVAITYDSAWDGLTKALVCRAGSIVKTILNVGGTATVAHECMVPNQTLFIGIEGRNADGTLVIPTVWARCGLICSGANADADPSADPTLPVWAQIEGKVGNLDNLNTEAKDTLVAAINEAARTGGGGGGLTTAQAKALDGMFKVCAFTKDNVSAEYTAFKTAFGITDSGGGDGDPDVPVTPDVTLTSISVTYSGGDVAVGTAVADLTGIVVTAHYSDGTSKAVTGYTLDGTIADGENTVTVIYGGKMTEFVVVGVAESGGEVIMLKNISFDGTSYLDTEVIPVDVNYDYVIGFQYPEAYPATKNKEIVGYWAGVSMRDKTSLTESNYMDMVFTTLASPNNNNADKPSMNIQLVFAGANYSLSAGKDKGDGLTTQMYDVPTYAHFSNANRSLWLDENLTVAPTTGHFPNISNADVMSEGQYYDANKMPIQSIWLGRPRVTSLVMQNQYKKIYAGVKFYCFKVYDSNENLIADMRPAKQGNTIGMWDNVRNKFYPVTGTANYEEVSA